MMLRSIFYGLTHGVVSGWKLEKACRNDNRFIVLSGNTRPDKRTLHRFLERHGELMPKLFVKIVRLAQEMGLVSLGRVAIDGSRFKGNTSSVRKMSYDKLQRAVGYIEEELKRLRKDLEESNAREATDIEDSLPEEIKNKTVRLNKIREAIEQIEVEHKEKERAKKGENPRKSDQKSLNDPEALSLSHKTKGFMFGYNLHAAVDEQSQIIVAADLHHKATDYRGLPRLLEQTKENCSATPEQVLADLGFKSAENVIAIEESNSTPIIAVGSEGSEELGTEFLEQVQPTKDPKEYRCMSGKILRGYTKKQTGSTEFTIPKEFCKGCAFAESCKAYGKKTISIPPENKRQAMLRLYSDSRTDEFKDSYKKRKAIVEPVFGNIKNKGLKILVTGKRKVAIWWQMACAAHNIEKIIKRSAMGCPLRA
jgi:hypothetical protein